MAVIREAKEEELEVKPEEEREPDSSDSFERIEKQKAKLFHTKKEAWKAYGVRRHLGVFALVLAALLSFGFMPLMGEVTDPQAVLAPAALVHVEALRPGRILRLAAKEGDFVEKGRTLAVIENPEELLEMSQTESELSSLEAELRLLDAKRILAFERFQTDQKLLKGRVISKDEFKSSELSFKTLEGERESLGIRTAWLREKLKFLEAKKKAGVVKAPVRGRVISDPESLRGSFVDKGEFLLTLASKEERVEFLLREEDYGRVEVGDRARIHFYAFPGKEFRGEVVRVKHYAEPLDKAGFKSAGIKVLIRLETPAQGIRNGMSARVKIQARRVSFFEIVRRRI